MIYRRLIVIAAALLLSVQVVRSAAATALSPLNPTAAAKIWGSHPGVEISLGLMQIGTDARERKSISADTFAMINDAAVKSPLASEPFMVRGVQARTIGDFQVARQAFLAAQYRNPRSASAAYFLADYYFRFGRALDGLKQGALLARLVPGASGSLAPFVAAYAENRSNWPQIRGLFRAHPWLEDSVLSALAEDPRNSDAILAVADPSHRRPDSPWLGILLRTLIAKGDYSRAREFWSSIGDAHPGAQLIYDTDFSSPAPPPPFNWALTTATIGLAEREPGKHLHVMFYGNQDGVLVSQLVLLPAGTYHFKTQLTGQLVHGELLSWSISCDKSTEPFSHTALVDASTRGWTFQVPANCPAQHLQLSGRSGDVAQGAAVTIAGLKLTRVDGDA